MWQLVFALRHCLIFKKNNNMRHNFMVAADSAVILFELESMFNGIRLEPTNKRFNSAYLQIRYFFKEKFTVIHFDYTKLFSVDHMIF